MLTSEHWIPVEGIHELPLVQALVDQQRRFVKPLRYDARNATSFSNALLLDAGDSPVPLHLVSVSSVPTFFRGERADLARNPDLNPLRVV